MLVLYHNDMSSCSQKVRLTLAEKSLEWTGRHMNLRRGDTRTDEYKKLNPEGVVPTLVTDGVVIIESTVIQEYLDDAYPEVPLKPTNPCARAMMRLWTRQLDVDIHGALSSISLGTAFRYQFMAGRTKAELELFIEQIPGSEKRKRIRDLVVNGIKSPYFAPALHRFAKLFSDMEDTLRSSTWLSGDTYSLADIAYTPYLTRFDHLQYLGMLDKQPRLLDWYERVKSRPNYSSAVSDWLNQEYLTLMQDKGEEAWPQVRQILTGTLHSGQPLGE